MEFLELVNKRYSCRLYDNKLIEKEIFTYILECALKAPSACNRQPFKIMILKNNEDYAAHCGVNGKWLISAPNIILILKKDSEGWIDCYGKSTSIIDATIFADYITLAASSQGLGTCWIKGFEEEYFKQCLNIPDEFDIVVLLAIGYPQNDSIPEKRRKSVEELLINSEID